MSLDRAGQSGCYFVGALTALVGLKMEAPTFIIGTGRCGTSLLIKILKSHKRLVTFPGEANNLWHPKSYPYSKRSIETPPILEAPQRYSMISLDHWPHKHENRIQNTFNGYHFIRGGSKIYIIKSAMISFVIPKILAIFPNCKFLHIYRSGPPVIESLVQKEWDKYSNYFDSKAVFRINCAKYWNDCILEIERQKSELCLDRTGALLEFSYENLCENPRAILGEIGRFLEVKPGEFSFDLSQIKSQNFKAGDYYHSEAWIDALKIMDAGMKLKGYALP